MKKLFLALLAFPAIVLAATLTATWTAPTTNTDGSAITATLTYNLYTGAAGAETKTQSALTSTTAAITATAGVSTCAKVTALANGVESAQSAEVCATPAFPTPNAPTGLTLK